MMLWAVLYRTYSRLQSLNVDVTQVSVSVGPGPQRRIHQSGADDWLSVWEVCFRESCCVIVCWMTKITLSIVSKVSDGRLQECVTSVINHPSEHLGCDRKGNTEWVSYDLVPSALLFYCSRSLLSVCFGSHCQFRSASRGWLLQTTSGCYIS